jgi:hypothetical protein
VLLVTQIASANEKPKWFYPLDIKFETYNGDTSFYSGGVSLWRIRQVDTLFEYYPDGYLQSVSQIKLSNSYTIIDTNKSEQKVNVFERKGFCKVFFDDSTKTMVASGQYKNNERVGDWNFYNITGKLIKVTEDISFGSDNYTIKEIDYSSGQPVLKVDRKFLAFYLKNFNIIILIIFGSFFGRVFINSSIYNLENVTNYSPIYFYFPGFVSKNWWHSMLCTFTLWFVNYKPENRRLVIISNALSLIALGTFFGLLIGLAINGELH